MGQFYKAVAPFLVHQCTSASRQHFAVESLRYGSRKSFERDFTIQDIALLGREMQSVYAFLDSCDYTALTLRSE